MKLPELKIANLTARIPIIQGGMAIRLSTGRLAGAVAAAGGIGLIAASGMEFEELAREIKIARDLANGGIVGINIMFVAREFLGIVNTAIKEKIDLIVSGAGFSRDLFKIGLEYGVPVVPIVSSAKLAKLSEKLGAAAIVIEGKEAGGHLGTDRPIKDLVIEIRPLVKLPIIAAGGIIDGQGIVDMLKLGANGVQIATKFVLSEECNAALEFKKMYQNAKEGDIRLITSPVGLPGRALKNPFSDKILNKTAPKPVGCDFCLKHCSLEYCIIQALINSQRGDVDHGVVFSGENVAKIKDRSIKPAAKIIEELVKEAEGAN
ncbi:MAG: nitronate monooxygenase [Candidatus Margulisbacteria bacterium]|nr:nitronate monooxygenase [Candidatus Margulisiibacteriota bacterium]MBU1021874.1 nitronate monooxygenase [Candidatus Margulisiibacteriota bacterium]MBU1728512.1 nitronate monooxygenase [Candidatus Margulisiibacteriota bacterium]MBU1954659.1 nitronate monooxygenase [Candidatus Margulisiibacteriota bacterium]